jgi:hypothetical protein
MTIQEMCTGDATVVPAALRGYRTWLLGRDGGLLARLPYEWSFGQQQATCLVGQTYCDCYLCSALRDVPPPAHSAPCDGCVCGFYGWYRPDDTRLQHGQVFGAIEVTGRVLMGTHGFRAERARVLGLVAEESAFRGGDIAALFRRAGQHLVPVYRTRAELLRALPPDDVSSLVDHTCDVRCMPHYLTVPVINVVPGGAWLAPMAKAARDIALAYGSEPEAAPEPETVMQRALRLRRTRNTGPAPRRLWPWGDPR